MPVFPLVASIAIDTNTFRLERLCVKGPLSSLSKKGTLTDVVINLLDARAGCGTIQDFISPPFDKGGQGDFIDDDRQSDHIYAEDQEFRRA